VSKPSVDDVLELGRTYPLPPAHRLRVLTKIIASMQIRGDDEVKRRLAGSAAEIAQEIIRSDKPVNLTGEQP
jgi:hypothetical protein